MDVRKKKALVLAPQIIGILFALFLCLFGLDVIKGEGSISQKIVDFLPYLVYPGIVVLLLYLSKRCNVLYGAVSFTVLGILYLVWAIGTVTWTAIILPAGFLFVLGILYFLIWIFRGELRK